MRGLDLLLAPLPAVRQQASDPVVRVTKSAVTYSRSLPHYPSVVMTQRKDALRLAFFV